MKLSWVAMLIVLAAAGNVAAQKPAERGFKPSLLGPHTRVVLSCANVVKSMAWWTRMGFSPTADGLDHPDSAITMQDGQVTITLVKDVLPSPILMFASSNMRVLKDTLDSMRVSNLFDVKGPTIGELRLTSPNGVHSAVRPSPSEHRDSLSGDSNAICGKLTELSIGAEQLMKEQRYWETLEFSVRRSALMPYPYAIMTDGFVNIGLHENRDISTVAFTYFALDMADRIERLRRSGMIFLEEMRNDAGMVEHAFLTSPDGQLVMLFTGDQ